MDPLTSSSGKRAAAFVVVVVVSIVLVALEHRHTDKAIRRANVAVLVAARANARAEANAEVNRSQNAVRRELIHHVMRVCQDIEDIKERIRATVRVQPRELYAETLRRFNPSLSDEQVAALYEQAKENEREVRERFAAHDCRALPGG